jgi:hypothetical protein
VRGRPGFDRSLGSETHAVIPTVYVRTCLVVGSWSAVPHMQLLLNILEHLEQADQILLKVQGIVCEMVVHPCKPRVV